MTSHNHGPSRDRESGHGHEHEHEHSALGGHVPSGGGNRRRVLVAALITCGFMVAEAVGGVLTGSLALLADAGHMLTDSVSLVFAYLAYRVADRPGTQRMTYGFDRTKVLVAYTNGLTIIGIGVWIVAEATGRFLEPAPVLGGPMLVIAALGLLVNVGVFFILHGGDRESLNLQGALLHVIGDLLGSVAALAAAVIILTTGWTPADPILSVLVALLLFRSAWMLIRKSGMILLEGAPEELVRDEVARDLEASVQGVEDVHHMHVWTLDGQQKLATLHARLAPGAEAHAAIDALKARLVERHGIRHATVEVEIGAECADCRGRARA